MKWLRNLLNAPLRGRVHRMSVTKGGEVSIVVRFGMEEMRARQLNQGALLDIVPHTAGKVAYAINRHQPAILGSGAGGAGRDYKREGS